MFLKYQLEVVDCLGGFAPHTYTIRVFGRGMGKSYEREEGNGRDYESEVQMPPRGGHRPI